MDNSKIYLDELMLLKNILDNKQGISTPKLYLGKILRNKNTLYKKIEKLRNYGLITSFRTKAIPPISKHKITETGIALLENFTTQFYPEQHVLEKKKHKNPPKTIVEYKECRKLEPDELAELSQSVVYYLAEALEKEIEDISKKKALKLTNIAEKIIKKVRNY
ncbi:hypothetical protein DSAG12_02139 [Promethearchaeum syntrophicum]|uniref:Uncharacterized protein n=1 Tax=Promethearchaeum syntrophicum TaxID=2594042 RepID=A0A5B9DAP7_9ARCH|nr:hypothetical protein [Candidatus Prometheoarchaeum syntrophicum]QEE16309.1 hypothetical protein DSAG12_02139 [Candidatus Prometheoarchaeum syntrophicum]